MASQKKKFFKPGNNLSYEEITVMQKSIALNEYEKNADLVLPQNSKFSFFGNKIAFCQVINAWFTKNQNSKVRIYDNYFSKKEEEFIKSIEKLVEEAELPTLLGLTFGLYTKILGYSNQSKDYTTYFFEPIKRRLISDYRELSRNYSNNESFSNEYFQIHPDFFEHTFYINNLTFYKKIGDRFYLQRESEIKPISQKLFKRLQAFDPNVSETWLTSLQTFFYEIFDNAFNWARTNWKISDDTLIEKSNRIFFISSKNYVNIKSNKHFNLNIDNQLFGFAKKNSVQSHWGDDTKLLELSFLDNGIGIPQTFRKDVDFTNLNVKEEYEILISAFAFRSTSDTSSKAGSRGIGLYKVINYTKSVFMIIRTGHLHLYRNFENHPYDEHEPFFLFDISDTLNDKNDTQVQIKKYPFIQGTLFTFIIPLLKNI